MKQEEMLGLVDLAGILMNTYNHKTTLLKQQSMLSRSCDQYMNSLCKNVLTKLDGRREQYSRVRDRERKVKQGRHLSSF